MRVLCRHGHYAFYPKTSEDLGRFTSHFKISLQPYSDFFTFPLLVNAPKFSITAFPFLNLPALTTYEGEPWQVMRENGFIYDITTGLLVPKALVLTLVRPVLSGFYFRIDKPLLQAGSINAVGFQQILSFDAEIDLDFNKLLIRSFSYE